MTKTMSPKQPWAPIRDDTPIAHVTRSGWWFDTSDLLTSTSDPYVSNKLRELLPTEEWNFEETPMTYIESVLLTAPNLSLLEPIHSFQTVIAHPMSYPAEIAVVPESSRSLRAIFAIQEIRQWLDMSLEEVAGIAGFAKRSVHYWQEGLEPRPSSVRKLFQLHDLLRLLSDSLGIPGLNAWLHEPSEDGPLRFEILGEPDSPGRLVREARHILFESRRPARLPWMRPDFSTEDLEVAPNPSKFGPPRRARRRGDR